MHWFAYKGVPLWRHPTVRGVALQISVVLAVLAICFISLSNAFGNLEARGVSTGFGFLFEEAGFSISEKLPIPKIGSPYRLSALALLVLSLVGLLLWQQRRGGKISSIALSLSLVLVVVVSVWSFEWAVYDYSSTYLDAITTGVVNTLNIAFYGIIIGSIYGVVFGFAQLSKNWMLRNVAYAITNTARNIPLLLQVVFWYFSVLKSMPGVKESVRLPGDIFLNNRGVYFPKIELAGSLWIYLAVLSVVLLVCAARYYGAVTKNAAGLVFGIVLALSATALLATADFELPVLRGFNFRGGVSISPEFVALLLGLVIYHGSFIADIVYAGVRAVPKGQTEASQSLGISPLNTARYVIFPQALRIIVPPLSLQYLGIAKNTSIGVAIAFPELVSVSRTVLNQSGQAIEVMLISLLFYLIISLSIAYLMNRYNDSVQLH